jgi:hypothetical protein
LSRRRDNSSLSSLRLGNRRQHLPSGVNGFTEVKRFHGELQISQSERSDPELMADRVFHCQSRNSFPDYLRHIVSFCWSERLSGT